SATGREEDQGQHAEEDGEGREDLTELAREVGQAGGREDGVREDRCRHGRHPSPVGVTSGSVRVSRPGARLRAATSSNQSGTGHPQAASIPLATCVIDGPEPNQAVIDFHSWPAPTAAGMRSDPSNRKVAFGSVRYFADSWSTGSV